MKAISYKLQTINYNKGQAVIMVVIFFLFISIAIIFGFVGPVIGEVKNARDLIVSKKSYFLAEAGIEDLSYRLKIGRQYSANESLNIDGFSTAITIADLSEDEKEIISTADVLNLIRKVKIKLTIDSGVSFHYGVQVGDGGLVMKNDALVSGNVYSNGLIGGFNDNLVKGDVISAGPGGSVNGIHATGTVYSHNIFNSIIDGDAYYVNISGSTVGGNLYPASPDQPTTTLPISDATINEWETAAAISEITSPCPYVIDSDITLGPVKISCNLEIQGSPTVTLLGPIWIAGNFTAQNDAIIRLDPSLGKKSIAIIADNPFNRLTSSKIELKNTANFQNSGTVGSYILIISQNNSSENNGSERAIEIQNDAFGDLLLYAGHGEILLKNDIFIKEVTAYKIQLQNTANVIYETGLASLFFKSGPGSGYAISGWREVE
ncbi:MAG: hypothetical protein A3A94_00630 [Candidatus Portnoybacteria bacterium RIFCSPLOWO2_01_FULL_43_11]|uniref:Type 4 fimbrial biogenesis protein PilX N-terminal domain-containing protein n=3 Tax=Candidatus Portnoyibacteriota TaxID=1817913 RepID=A0A1G2FAN5_9BACT|nr:MAG: hypothetical protein A2815_02220 [Candidatus Portnoybacteria bacterium RIFCSPHIGHO2_01_FULL_40_12b]OGZ36994.1 MAG: hypothetical protein A3D38_00750 [Candidatus Portnoybacteria bacterium RIFCSPHIGHO2_02_FULL_40_23]OGZ38351.1 MAG: hypothetical protein A3A94_00630 [Candidatus Portnoybacteria bacterium RIFCSPLOWO2_01_FULL_43_11]OGZ39601.1 MAG: hypothetical protein A3I20_00355 [Candidatus Portnoybacteria bacterium RIFCSPLOWO2_02_FULL_40_15]